MPQADAVYDASLKCARIWAFAYKTRYSNAMWINPNGHSYARACLKSTTPNMTACAFTFSGTTINNESNTKAPNPLWMWKTPSFCNREPQAHMIGLSRFAKVVTYSFIMHYILIDL